MSVNRELPHVLVLPEDDANRQIANGFHLQVVWARQRQMQVLPAAHGWMHVIEDFLTDHAPDMDHYPQRLMILLIDSDGDAERLQTTRARIPEHLTERVFILGALTEPEKLKPDLGPYERIGHGMAQDCREGTDHVWGHVLLQNNSAELERLRPRLCPILFEQN